MNDKILKGVRWFEWKKKGRDQRASKNTTGVISATETKNLRLTSSKTKIRVGTKEDSENILSTRTSTSKSIGKCWFSYIRVQSGRGKNAYGKKILQSHRFQNHNYSSTITGVI